MTTSSQGQVTWQGNKRDFPSNGMLKVMNCKKSRSLNGSTGKTAATISNRYGHDRIEEVSEDAHELTFKQISIAWNFQKTSITRK